MKQEAEGNREELPPETRHSCAGILAVHGEEHVKVQHSDPVAERGTDEDPGRRGGRRRAVRPVLWRLHFFAGLLAGPVIVWLALSGIAFAWNSQIEAVIYDKALTAVSDAPDRPLAQQVRAAAATHPEYAVTAVVPAAADATGGEETTAVTLSPPDPATNRFGQDAGVVTVYVDPGSARVSGQIVEANRPDEWIRNLHSNWLIGQGSWAEPLTEMAASWVVVSLLTGLYLWWPRSRRGWRKALRLRPRGSSRARWRTVHTSLGVLIAVALLVQVATGLTWARFAGKWVDAAKEMLASEPATVSTTLPRQGFGSSGELGSIDAVAASAREAGLAQPIKIVPAAESGQAWTVATVDDRWPIDTATVAIDPATGAVTDSVGWADQPPLEQATTLAINFHTGKLFGLANQVFLTLLALAVTVLVVAGYRMWWRRRPAGGLGAPPRVGPLLRSVPVPLLLGFGVLMVFLPMLAVSFAIYLLVERAARGRRLPARSLGGP